MLHNLPLLVTMLSVGREVQLRSPRGAVLPTNGRQALMANRKSQQEHDLIVQSFADALVEKGFPDVRADVPQYQRPAEIESKRPFKGRIPDITTGGDSPLIIEVETADSVRDEHTKLQWTLFAEHAKATGATFCVAVPRNAVGPTRQRLRELGIEAEILKV